MGCATRKEMEKIERMNRKSGTIAYTVEKNESCIDRPEPD